MITRIDWSKQPDNTYTTITWLHSDPNVLYNEFNIIIKQHRLTPEHIDSLLRLFPYLIEHPNIKQWGILLRQIVKQTIEEGADIEGLKTFKIGHSYLLPRQPEITPLPKKQATRRRHPRERLNGNEIFEYYLVLLMAQVFQHPKLFSADKIDGLLYTARHITTAVFLTYKAYQALAYMELLNNRPDKSIPLGELAYNYWSGFSGELASLEAGQSARALAQAYTAQGDTNNQQFWTQRAESLFQRVKDI